MRKSIFTAIKKFLKKYARNFYYAQTFRRFVIEYLANAEKLDVFTLLSFLQKNQIDYFFLDARIVLYDSSVKED